MWDLSLKSMLSGESLMQRDARIAFRVFSLGLVVPIYRWHWLESHFFDSSTEQIIALSLSLKKEFHEPFS